MTESLKDEADFVIKVVSRMSANGQVIHINDKPSCSNVVRKVEVHKHLERRWGAAKSEKHYRWFEQSKRRDEGSFPFITLFDSNVVIPPSYVKLGEERELAKVIDEVGDKG